MSPPRRLAALLAWSLWSGAAGATPCDSPAPVRFAPGATAGEIAGGIARGELACFTIAARQGQHLVVSQPGRHDSNVVMQIYRPPWTIAHSPDGIRVDGRALQGAAEREDAKAWAGTLPQTGRYLLVLGTSWGGEEYRVRVEIR
jgi:hypothetical protein